MAQVRSADVLYTHFNNIPTRAYRVGDECFVPVDEVSHWGWTVNVSAELARIKAEGVEFTVPIRVFSGRQAIPIRAAVTKAGGQSGWVMNSDTLEVYSELTTLSVNEGKIRFFSPLEVRPKTFYLGNPSRFVVDIEGARLGPKTLKDLDGGSKAVQYRPNTVRLIVDTPNLPQGAAAEREATHLFQMELSTSTLPAMDKPSPTRTKSKVDEPPAEKLAKTQDPAQGQAGGSHPETVTSDPEVDVQQSAASRDIRINLEQETAETADLSVPLPPIGTQVTFRKIDPRTIEISIPGLYLQVPADFQSPTESLESASARTDSAGTYLTLTFARPMGAQVWSDQSSIHIGLQKPNVGDGKLAGKLIVVDPGHGGHDRGAHSGSINEKDLNLAIGKLIAKKLSEAGATVILTRKTDVFIPLNTRADIANNANADLFISSHINSTGGSGTQSGGITFHHKGRDVCRLLADCIQQEIAKVSGLPNLGTWSDGRIYQSGFAVLRQTKMPGVLLELGFINNAKDRKRIVTQDFQDSVAAAVVEGIKVFLGDAKEE